MLLKTARYLLIMKNTEKLIKLLSEKHLTISSVESLTGGLFAATLASVPGASKVLKGALVTYQSNFKTSLLGIKKNVIDKYGVVSDKIASLMVEKAYSLTHTDIVISFTGNAGPSKEKGKAHVGEVHVAILCKPSPKKIKKFSKVYKGDRNSIRSRIVEDSITLLLKHVRVMFK